MMCKGPAHDSDNVRLRSRRGLGFRGLGFKSKLKRRAEVGTAGAALRRRGGSPAAHLLVLGSSLRGAAFVPRKAA